MSEKKSASQIWHEKNRERMRAYHREKYLEKKANGFVTQERLRKLLCYDESTGVFTYLERRGPFAPGDVAGYLRPDGRYVICVDGRLYKAHRLAWLYVTGVWPSKQIDHIDGNPGNNAFSNLRDVSDVVNKQNIKKAPAGKKYSNLLGAHWCERGQHWKSSISVCGVRRYLGVFDTAEEASAAYMAAKRRLHEGCTI